MKMTLTAAQLATWKTDITANTNTVLIGDVPTAINTLNINNGDHAFAIAAWYNGLASPDFFGNYHNVPASAVMNAVTWKNFTPTDAVPTDTSLNVDIHQGRTLLAQSYQFNLQTMLVGRDIIDATKASIVGGLKDCLNTNIPTGASGAGQKCGWSAVQTILCRKGSRIEKLLADTSGGTGADNTHAATFTFEGNVTDTDLAGQ